jgi:hypothetical protein
MAHNGSDAMAGGYVLASRATSLGFAQRAFRNLKHIEEGAIAGAEVHGITQTLLSVLGLVVFPWAEGIDATMKSSRYPLLVKAGWPAWNISLGNAKTLDDLVRHLRNAISHRRFTFSSDSPDGAEVTITFEDAKGDTAPVHWRASIEADQLRAFCLKFLALVDPTLG